MQLIRFIKNWTLPVSMVAGTCVYLFFAGVEETAPVKPLVWGLISFLTPSLIFAQLFLTFCKVDVRDFVPKVWHLWLLLFQLATFGAVSWLLVHVDMPLNEKIVWEGAMVCLICPTATAAPVITGKLGGSAASLTTYTLFSNFLAAVCVPLVFPLVEAQVGLTFLSAFLKILSKVFFLLICPFLLAQFIRLTMPRLHRFLLKYPDAAFYIWAVALAIVTGQTVRSLAIGEATVTEKGLIALAALITCVAQFAVGKYIGTRYHERISAGQALGQKNTVLAIWMAHAYLNPLSSVAPGAYVLWQNSINSYQLWKKRKRDEQGGRS